VPLAFYYDALGVLDVGMVPLESSVFNKCKSGLKIAEFAARGIPAVATPSPATVALRREGYPVLFADSPREWYTHLAALLRDPDLRAEMSQAAYETARRLSLENQADQWERAWLRAQRRSRVRA
jgi:glycosyltransferase involved in cell wall biosynthesis